MGTKCKMSYEQHYIYQEKSTSVNENGRQQLTRTTTQWTNKNGDRTFHQSRTNQVGRRENKVVIEGTFENGDYAVSETEYLNGQAMKVSRYRLTPDQLKETMPTLMLQ